MPSSTVNSHNRTSWCVTWGNGSHSVGLEFDFKGYVDGVSTTASVASLVVDGQKYKLKRDVDLSGGFNSLAIEWGGINGDEVTISVGHKIPQQITTAKLPRPGSEESIRIDTAPQSAKIDVEELILETEITPEQQLATQWSEELLTEYLLGESHSPIEGIWEYMDRENDSRIAQLGGNYRVGVVANSVQGGYDIIYLDGARVNAGKWHAGMRKGRLMPTIFDGQYRLEWYDATFEPISTDTYAELTQSALLTLQFPTLSASVRLSKVITR